MRELVGTGDLAAMASGDLRAELTLWVFRAVVGLSRLSEIENKGTIPTFYRLYSLCAIYRMDLLEVLEWYGINIGELPVDSASADVR